MKLVEFLKEESWNTVFLRNNSNVAIFGNISVISPIGGVLVGTLNIVDEDTVLGVGDIREIDISNVPALLMKGMDFVALEDVVDLAGSVLAKKEDILASNSVWRWQR